MSLLPMELLSIKSYSLGYKALPEAIKFFTSNLFSKISGVPIDWLSNKSID
jgi:hypothetical protein